MKRILFLLFICLLPSFCVFGQTKAVSKIATKISTKATKKAAFEAAKRRTAKELLEEGIARTGRKYTGEALGQQITKRAIRENVLKRMEKEGIESFLMFGKNEALKDMQRLGISNVKQGILVREAATATRPSAYHAALGSAGRYVSKTMTRILIRSKNQFVTSAQYIQWLSKNNGKITKTGVKNSEVLRENMLAVMGKDAKYVTENIKNTKTLKNANQAHHIIGNGTPKAAETLSKYGIDINDPMNGVFLPYDEKSGLRGTIHSGGHTRKYYDYVEQKFSACKSKEDCYKVLDQIKLNLYEGKVKLYNDGVNKVNKTFRTVG